MVVAGVRCPVGWGLPREFSGGPLLGHAGLQGIEREKECMCVKGEYRYVGSWGDNMSSVEREAQSW